MGRRSKVHNPNAKFFTMHTPLPSTSSLERPLTKEVFYEYWTTRSFALHPLTYFLLLICEIATIMIVSSFARDNEFISDIIGYSMFFIMAQIVWYPISFVLWVVFVKMNFPKGTSISDVVNLRSEIRKEIKKLHQDASLPPSTVFPNNLHEAPLTRDNYSRLWGGLVRDIDPRAGTILTMVLTLFTIYSPLAVILPVAGCIFAVAIALNIYSYIRWFVFIKKNLPPKTTLGQAIKMRDQFKEMYRMPKMSGNGLHLPL